MLGCIWLAGSQGTDLIPGHEVSETKWLGDCYFPALSYERLAQEGSVLKRNRVGSDFCESLPGLSEVPWLMGASGAPYL